MLVSRITNVILAILSIIFGIIIGVLFTNGSMPYIRGLVKINVVLPVVLLLIYIGILALAYFLRSRKLRSPLAVPGLTVLISSAGTLVTAISLLAGNIVPASVAMRIMVGIGGTFFSLMILSFVYFIIRIVRRIMGLLSSSETTTETPTEN